MYINVNMYNIYTKNPTFKFEKKNIFLDHEKSINLIVFMHKIHFKQIYRHYKK